MSDTPETDKYCGEDLWIGEPALVSSDFARKLERERDEAREALRVLFKDYKELADSGDAGFWELEDQEAAQPALRILQQMEDTNSITKPEQVSSKLARYKKDAEVVTDEQEVFRRLVEAIVTTDMTANTLLEVRRLFGDEIDAAVACLRRTEK